MGIKTYNPYTPSRRNMTGSDFSEITKDAPEKSLCGTKMNTFSLKNKKESKMLMCIQLSCILILCGIW